MKLTDFLESLTRCAHEIDECGRPVMYKATRKSRPVALDGTTFESILEAQDFYMAWVNDDKPEINLHKIRDILINTLKPVHIGFNEEFGWVKAWAEGFSCGEEYIEIPGYYTASGCPVRIERFQVED